MKPDPRVILVVDDSPENWTSARATLEGDSYRVIIARAEEVVERTAAEHPGCVVMDIHMPGVDGIVACERIRRLPGGDAIAIVFVTAERDVEVFDRARAAGGDDFITKPCQPAELTVRIETAMTLRRIAVERDELYVRLKHQRDELQRVRLQNEQFVAFLVHDLKNPVHAIDLYAQAIFRNTDDIERTRHSAARIRSETSSLMRMLTNLLDISRADEGGLAPAIHPVEVAPLVEGVLDEMMPHATAAKIRLETELVAQELQADVDLLVRVLANLVDNAIHHAPEGTSVRIVVVPGEGTVELRVSDAGPGIPRDQRTAVFKRFSSSRRTRTNRGLGLAFCKVAVEAQGGRIWIEDGNPGAVFCISLRYTKRRP